VRDDFSIKSKFYCEIYLCIEYPEGHPERFEGIQTRDFWVKLFSESVIYKRNRGVAVISLGHGKTSGTAK
jgi:hypothetical protein